MEKSKLTLKSHTLILGEEVVEIWYENILIGTVCGADGPGVRVISKYPMDIVRGGMGEGETIGVMEVRIELGI